MDLLTVKVNTHFVRRSDQVRMDLHVHFVSIIVIVVVIVSTCSHALHVILVFVIAVIMMAATLLITVLII